MKEIHHNEIIQKKMSISKLVLHIKNPMNTYKTIKLSSISSIYLHFIYGFRAWRLMYLLAY